METPEKIDLFKQLRKSDYAQPKKPALVEVGQGLYLTVEGRGEPGGPEFETRVGALYAVAYTIKMTRKFAGKQDYVVGKLEGQWWSDEGPDLKRIPKRKWRWRLMIRTPELVRRAELSAALKNLEKKGKAPGAEQVRLESIAGGSCVQMLHLGPYDREWESIEQMLAFAGEQGLTPHGRHHEIYISDPRRVPPERLKTILRLPVRRRGRAAPRSG
jgi:hypothetical protein